MRNFLLFVLLFVFLGNAQAQDIVIGGKPTISPKATEEYDSLENFYGHPSSDISSYKRMIGQNFTYYNINNYANGYFQTPYPWKDGRVRSGKYTSSQTAKDAYLAELKKKNGTKYTLSDIVTYDGKSGLIFTDANGESIFYPDIMFATGEFICDGYKEKVKKELVGKTIRYNYKGNRERDESRRVWDYFSGYIDLNSRELHLDLPFLSDWTITSVGVDTTYWEDHTPKNDIDNSSCCHLVLILHNDELGDFECYSSLSGLLGEEQNNLLFKSRFAILDKNKIQIFDWGTKIKTYDWNGQIPSSVIEAAKSGNPDAVYAIWKYRDDFRGNLNIPIETLGKWLINVIDQGCVTHSSHRYLLYLAYHYIPTYDENSDKNKYAEGIPYLTRAAKLRDTNAIEYLIQWIEKGKIPFDQASEVLETVASELEPKALLFLGNRLISGENVKNPQVIIDALEKFSQSNSHDSSKAKLILMQIQRPGSEKSIDGLKLAADNDDWKACLELGELFYEGKEVDKNWDLATDYLYKGTYLGLTGQKMLSERRVDAKYFYMLATIYQSEKNNRCVDFFVQALEYGSESPYRYEAAIQLGEIFYEGKLMKKNDGLAGYYFLKAFIDGKLGKGKELFVQYNLKDALTEHLELLRDLDQISEDELNDMLNCIK